MVAAAACFVSRIAAANVDDPGQIARDNIIIQFDDSSFTTDPGSDAAVYSVDELDGPVPRTFYWTATKLAPVTDVWLIGEGADYIVHQSPEGKVGMPPATAAVNNVVAAGSKDAKRATSQVKMDVDAYQNNTGGSITIRDLIPIGTDTNGGFGKRLHFKVLWNSTGATYSRTFTVTNVTDLSQLKALQEEFNSNKPYLPEEIPSVTSGTQTTSVSEPTASTSVALTSTVSGPASTDSSASVSSDTKKSGGLSTGAIAGIAVACGVIGLVLLGAAIWYFCFRRRRGDGVSAAPYGSDRHHRTQELIAEKEANAGVTESSPHSPYSDDGQQQQHPAGLNGMNGSMPLQQPLPNGRDSAHFAGAAAPIMAPSPHPHSIGDRSYTPYSDHRGSGVVGTPETQQSQPVHYEQQSERGAPSPQPASQPAAARSVSPQQPITGRYAHLVEEGMTEDEIRRLEEEERQLDAAIADREAGRGR